jgi:hypothetical protein
MILTNDDVYFNSSQYRGRKNDSPYTDRPNKHKYNNNNQFFIFIDVMMLHLCTYAILF